jgi:tRNA modification GTPase
MGFGILLPEEQSTGRKRPVLLVLNKADQEQHIQIEELRGLWPGATFVRTSALSDAGLQRLEDALADQVLSGKMSYSESMLVTSTRHQEALRQAVEHLDAALSALKQGVPLDFVSIDLRAAYEALGEVTGETASEDLLDKIFSEFCIGK